MAVTAGGTPYVESSDLVANYPGASLALANRVDQVMQAPTQKAITATTYQPIALDAGVTVTLNNAAAVTVTIPAQATVTWVANTQLNFLNIGAGTVTITPAATVTINGTPLTLATSKGGSLVRTASNTWTFIPTGGDSPGLNPVAPTSIANSGGSASTTGNTTTFSAVSSLSLNGVFTSSFSNYSIILDSTLSGIAQFMFLRLRLSGTDDTSANYFRQRLVANNAVLTGERVTSQTRGDYGISGPSLSTSTSTIINPALAANTGIITFNTGMLTTVPELYLDSVGHNVATAFDGLTIFPNTGTMTGKIRVYGYRN